MAISIKQNDTYPPVVLEVFDTTGRLMNLSTVREVRFHMGTARGEKVFTGIGAVVGDPTQGRIGYQWAAGETSRPGFFLAEFEVEFTDFRQMSVPANGFLEIDITRQIG